MAVVSWRPLVAVIFMTGAKEEVRKLTKTIQSFMYEDVLFSQCVMVLLSVLESCGWNSEWWKV